MVHIINRPAIFDIFLLRNFKKIVCTHYPTSKPQLLKKWINFVHQSHMSTKVNNMTRDNCNRFNNINKSDANNSNKNII